MEESIDSLSSVVEEIPDNLLFISEHSEQNLFDCIERRMARGKSYTFAGSILVVANNEKTQNEFSAKLRDSFHDILSDPHLYSMSSKVLQSLKSDKKSQVLSLIGHSGAGKTFASIHLLDHLIHESGSNSELFSLLHASIQVLHVMGSVASTENSESTCCGLVTTLNYDSKFLVSGASIKAKLFNCSLPFSQSGNSYHVLHSLVASSRTQLQSLGLNLNPTFKLFNNRVPSASELQSHTQNHERFIRNLQFLQFTRAEIQEILELLSCVILLFEINFVGNSFVRAGDKEYTEWAPRHRGIVQKLCKMLMVTEDKFVEVFQGSQSKGEVENRVKEMARAIYEVVFEWMLVKVNGKLKGVKDNNNNKKKKEELVVYNVAIVDFPGFLKNSSLGGFCSNLAFECLNLFAADRLIGLMHALETDKISMNILKPPISKEIISILMSKESGLLQCLDLENFERYWKEFQTIHKNDSNITATGKSLVIKYTWGDCEYDIYSIRQEVLKYIHPSEFNSFFSKCSNSLLKKLANPIYLSLSDSFRKDVSVLLEPLIEFENSLLYFIKAPSQKLDYNETIRFFRNTLVIPCLVWEWYGYQHWVSNSKLLNDLDAKLNSLTQPSTLLTTLLLQTLPTDDFIVGLHYTLFKDHAHKKIFEKITEKTLKMTPQSYTDATFQAFSPESSQKIIRAKSSKVIKVNQRSFEYNVHGDPPIVDTGIHEYLDYVADINDMSFRKDSFRSVGKSSVSSSTKSIREPLQTVQSKKHFQTLKTTLSNFRLFSYSDHMPSILCIQRIWKGFLARRYYKAYLVLKSKATLIQSFWKSRKQRKLYKSILKGIKLIQNTYRSHFASRIAAVITLQTWYRSIKSKFKGIEAISSEISSIQDATYPLLHTAKRSLLKPSKIPDPNVTFKPNILTYSRTLAKQHESKLGNQALRVEERLGIMDLLKKNKIDDLRKMKIEEERKNLRLSPSINKSQEFNSSFLQRQEVKSQQIRMKREMEYMKKQSEESCGLTFKPKLIARGVNKSGGRSVNDLHIWAEMKKAEISKAQRVKAEEETRSLSPFVMSDKSKKILQQREKKLSEAQKAISEYKEAVLPYWPDKKA